jgi:hypothetical protein
VDVDYARAWLALKEVVLSKRSHGQDGLLQDMTRLEIECRVPEGQEGFSDLPRRPSGSDPADVPVGANGSHAQTH